MALIFLEKKPQTLLILLAILELQGFLFGFLEGWR